MSMGGNALFGATFKVSDLYLELRTIGGVSTYVVLGHVNKSHKLTTKYVHLVARSVGVFAKGFHGQSKK